MISSRETLELRLENLERGARTLVLTHDFPDPDSLASAAGLGRLLEVTRSHRVTLAYGGFIGRAENRQMVELLELHAVPIEALCLDEFDVVALVDTQPLTGNNALPASRLPDIVIDHHPLRPTSEGVAWLDVREEFGACATLVMEYLRHMGVPIGSKLATALYYAILSETQDLARETHAVDIEAYRYLFSLVDRRLLGAIRNPPVPAEYFRLLSRAVERSRVVGPLLVVDLQSVPFPEIVAEMADLLMRLEGVEWVLSMGHMDGDLYLSMRTRDEHRSAGDVIQTAVGNLGKAGGHGSMAGGRVPAPDVTAARAAIETITHRLTDLFGLDATPQRSV